jgi:large subunit ribosomal protein L29
VPILRLKDIKSMSAEERIEKVTEFRAELARLKTMVRAGGAVENPARIRELRKTIAKILTIENEAKLEIRKKEEKPVKKRGKKEKKTK